MNKNELNLAVVGLMSDLHAYNKLDKDMVYLIRINFGVDAEELCKEYGITYDVD